MTIFNVSPGSSIQTAINSAVAGDSIHLLAGTHTTGSLIYKSGLTFFGDGDSSIVYLANATNTNVFRNLHIDTGDSGVVFRNFMIDGNKTNQTHDLNNPRHGIAAYKVSGLVVENMHIKNTEKDAVYLGVESFGGVTSGPCDGVLIQNSILELSMRHGIGITSAKNVLIYHNTIRLTDDLGIDLEPNSAVIDYIENIRAYWNYFYNIGLDAYGGAGNGTCFQFAASGASFKTIRLFGNYAFCDHADGFSFGKSSSPTANDVYVVGNVAEGNMNGGMYVSQTGHHFYFFGNRIDTTRPWLDYRRGLTCLDDASYITYDANYVTGFYYGLASQTSPGHTLDHISYINNVSDSTADVSGGGGTYTNITLTNNSVVPPDPSDQIITMPITPLDDEEYIGAVTVMNWSDATTQTADIHSFVSNYGHSYDLINSTNFAQSISLVGSAMAAAPIPMTGWTPYSLTTFNTFLLEDGGVTPCVVTVPVLGSRMVQARYYVVLKNQKGERVALFDNFIKLEYQKEINGVSNYTMTIDGNDTRKNLFELDGQIEIYRSVPALGIDWYIDFEGFHRTPEISTDQNGVYTYTSNGVGYNDLLARTIIGYKEGTIRGEKNAPAETVMKEFVLENCGSEASISTVVGRLSNGVLPGFSVETNSGAGAIWAGVRAYENLLETLSDIASTSYIDFNVVGVGAAQFEFKTYVSQLGRDLTWSNIDVSTGYNGAGNLPMVFGIELDNARNIDYKYDRVDESNTVYVLGKGDISLRQVIVRKNVTAMSDSPWNRREVSRPGSSQEYEYQLEQMGDEALKELGAKETFQFEPIQTETSFYGKHYGLGDRISVRYSDDILRHKRITTVSVAIESNTEQVSFEFSDLPTGPAAPQPGVTWPIITPTLDVVVPPNLFTYHLPFTIVRNDRVFSPSAWDVSSLEPITTATMYVSPNGDDTNTGVDLARAFRTIEYAIGQMTGPTTIWLDDGFYGENTTTGTGGHWRGANPAYSLSLKAINPGTVISSPKVYQLTWSVHDAPTFTYKATYAGTVMSVWDGVTQTEEDYSPLTLQASIANVMANAGSWYQTGGVVYVHLTDERAPDAYLHVFRDMIEAYCVRDNITIYLEGIEFQGGTNGAGYFRNASSAGELRVYSKNCKFKYSGATGGLAIEGATEVISQNCLATFNQNDGFNYHVRNTIVPDAIEINCVAHDNGTTSDSDNNGSSMHDGGRICRIMGLYYENYGPNVIDINDTLSYNLGCDASASQAPDNTQRHNFYSDAYMWLDRCNSSGSHANSYDLVVLGAGDAIYYRELISDNKFSNTGGGILTSY